VDLRANLRKLVSVKAIVVLAIVAFCLLALSLAGRDLLQLSLGEISRASLEAKPLVDISNPVMPWEVELYEKYRLKQITIPEIGLVLSKTWEISPSEVDTIAWIARMKIYANFLDIFGFLLYFPGPMWFKVTWELYGETTVIVATILLVASRAKNTHLRHAALITAAAFVVFMPLIQAPITEGVWSGDITYSPNGWNFNEWALRYSITRWGEVPFWVRYKYSGYPYLGDPQMMTFYPSTLATLLLANELIAIRCTIVVHAVMAGLFMYLLMNTWGQKPQASMVGAIGFMLSGFFFSRIRAGHLTLLYGYVWIPAILAFLELAVRRRDLRFAGLAGLCVALQAQSGILISFYTIILLGIYLLVEALPFARSAIRHPERARNTVLLLIKVFLVATAFAMTISASKIMPSLEVYKYIPRGPYALQESELYRGIIPDAGQLLQTFFFRAKTELEFPAWGIGGAPYSWAEYWSYMGVVAILGFAAIPFLMKSLRTAFLTATIVTSGLLSMGILYGVLFNVLPFFSWLRSPGRFLMLAQFAFCALAAFSVTRLQTWLERRFEASLSEKRAQRIRISVLVGYLITGVVFLDLATAGSPFVQTMNVAGTLRPSPAMIYMAEDTREPFRVYTTTPPNIYRYGVNGLETTWLSPSRDLRWPSWEFSINSYTKYHLIAQTGSYKMFGALNVKYVVSNDKVQPTDGLQFVKNFSDVEFLYLNDYYVSRVQCIERGILILTGDSETWEETAIGVMLSQPFDPRTTILVWAEYLDDFTLADLKRFDIIYIRDSSLPTPNPVQAQGLLEEYKQQGGNVVTKDSDLLDLISKERDGTPLHQRIEVSHYTANGLEGVVEIAKPAFLFISEVYIPGWRVYVDGKETRLLQADDIFIGVSLEQGRHALKIEFVPETFALGLSITLASYSALFLMLLPTKTRSRMKQLFTRREKR